MIFAIIMSALIFSKLLAYSGVTTQIASLLTATWLSKWGVVVLVTIIYLILGTLMDAPALLAVTLPITEPVMISLGFDPIWFGVYVVLLAEIGAITPPVGINCFVVQGASEGAVSIEDVFSGIAPYVLAGLVMLVILCAFPGIALFLPEQMTL
ncbi:TRAP transporter large permease protein OS=Castellaniella defragrans OX=75697 GN=HNR28_001725 PE=3 SV=1 [Castellaniella defragrans]